ncbi:MAG: aldehyde dehydrogenase family protein, partial [Hydrogenophaga sp.]
MGAAEQINWVDAACWNGTAFDGGWNTRLANHQDVLEPATGQPLWRVGVASAADMTAAIERAHAAQAAWAATPPRERAAVMLKAAALFEQHFDELALMIARETGGIIPKGQHEVRESVVLCQLAAAMPMQAQGQVLPSTPGRLSIARRVPHGVVGIISPFNFPLNLAAHKIAPALAVGCPFVMKPASRTPLGALIIGEVLAETD